MGPHNEHGPQEPKSDYQMREAMEQLVDHFRLLCVAQQQASNWEGESANLDPASIIAEGENLRATFQRIAGFPETNLPDHIWANNCVHEIERRLSLVGWTPPTAEQRASLKIITTNNIDTHPTTN